MCLCDVGLSTGFTVLGLACGYCCSLGLVFFYLFKCYFLSLYSAPSTSVYYRFALYKYFIIIIITIAVAAAVVVDVKDLCRRRCAFLGPKRRLNY